MMSFRIQAFLVGRQQPGLAMIRSFQTAATAGVENDRGA
jgi:hypothetical protein